MADDILRIKKYPNRRLYDTEQSRYITLDELARLVRGGRRVQVVDARSGADLTGAVLLGVILEDRGRTDLLPVELLHHLIRVQGTVQEGPFTRWLEALTGQWLRTGEQLRQSLGPLMGGGIPNPLSAMMGAWPGGTTRDPSQTPPPPEAPDEPPQEAPDEPPKEAPDEPPQEAPAGDPAARVLREQMEALLKRLG